MGLTGRVVAYAGLGVLLAVAFDPRTWGQDLGAGDDTGAITALMFLLGVAQALAVLTVVVLVVETTIRARRRRSSGRGGARAPSEDAGRSWYE